MISTKPGSVAAPGDSGTTSPPLVPGWPLLGNGWDLLRDALGAFVRGYHALGPIYRVKVPSRRYTVLAGPKANAFLLNGGERFLTSEPVYQGLARQIRSSNYPVVASGRRHQHLRRALAPAFSREAISPYVPRLVDIARREALTWKPGDRVRVPHAMRRIVAEQISLALTGRPLGPRLRDVVMVSRVSMGAGLGAYPALTVHWPPYRRARRRLDAFLEAVVAEHRRAEPGAAREPDLIDVLLTAIDPDGAPFSAQDIAANAQMVFTSTLLYAAPTCACLLYALLKTPAVLERVRAEVDAAFAAGPPSLVVLKRLRTLHAAMRESMRLYPIALTVPRVVAQSFEFEGYTVPVGETILVATSVCHFLDEYFPEPYTFDVTRFWEPRSEHRQPGAFAPYGLGARPCLGAGFVEIMVMATIAALLQSVTLDLDPPGYVMRRVVNPFPEPEDRMSVRVLEHRALAGGRAAARPVAVDSLGDIPFSLDRESFARVAARIHTLSYAPGEVIIRQGDRADRFYILTQGEVEVVQERADGPPSVLRRLGRGEGFGEIGLLQNVRRTATVRALSPVTSLALDRDAFLEMIADNDLTSGEIGRLVRQRVVTSQLATALPRLGVTGLARVLPQVEARRASPGDVIVRQGDEADRFYVITAGRVEVVNHHPDGRDIVIGRLGPGDFFGEIGLLQRQPRMATVRAVDEGVELIALGRQGFEKLLQDSPDAHADIVAAMDARLREVSGMV